MRGWLAVFWLAGSCLPINHAQTPPAAPAAESSTSNAAANNRPLEIEVAHLNRQRQLLAASLNPLKAYLSVLDEFARQCASERKYETAIAARAERQTMRLELERIDKEMLLLETREKAIKTTLLPERILLPLDKAALNGVEWDVQRKTLSRWQAPGASAEWQLPALPPGGYEVLLTYQCTPLEGGTLSIEERVFSLRGEMDTTLRGPETKLVGTLKITDGSGPLRLVARTVVKSNLMDLLTVELVPANR